MERDLFTETILFFLRCLSVSDHDLNAAAGEGGVSFIYCCVVSPLFYLNLWKILWLLFVGFIL